MYLDNTFTEKWTNSVTHGDNIPGWRLAILEGRDATTSLSGSKKTVSVKRGRITTQRDSVLPTAYVLGEIVGCCGLSLAPPIGNPTSISFANADNQAKSKFLKKLIEVNQTFQGGVFLGELKQTLESIKNPARGLRNLVDKYRGRAVNLRRARNFRPVREQITRKREDLADLWLEHSFHWKPLLSDIDSGAEALAKLVVGQSLAVKRITAKAESKSNPVETSSFGGISINLWYTKELQCDEVLVIYRGAVRVNPSNSVQMAPELLGFDPASFVPTAWELVPYSFLIDYFTNIGDIIAGWSHGRGGLNWCNRTIKQSIVARRMAHGDLKRSQVSYPDIRSVTSSPAQVIATNSNVSRAKYLGSLIPSFTWEIPGSGSKWLNIAALVAARSGDRRFSYGD